jgi:hypothetical protein
MALLWVLVMQLIIQKILCLVYSLILFALSHLLLTMPNQRLLIMMSIASSCYQVQEEYICITNLI